MKKTTLFLFALLLCWSSNAQLSEEGFETGWTLAPTGASATSWFTMQNDVSTGITWIQGPASSPIQHPAYSGERAAFLQRQNVFDGTPFPEDYLVTPEFEVPQDPELHFYSRLTFAENQGSIYKIFIINITETPDADLNSPASYTEIQTWTELEINPVQTEYYHKIVQIPTAYIGARVRIAFMMTGDDMDRWLIDNVSVTKKCDLPLTLEANNITMHSADLTWANPSGATKWDIELIPDGIVPTGVPTDTYTGTLPYHIGGLDEDSCYKFYVRAQCDGGGKSDWAGATFFCTAALGDSCTDPLPIITLPYTHTDNTAEHLDIYNGNTGGCGTAAYMQYLNGNDVVYAYTPTQTGIISVNLTNISESYAGVSIYTSCEDIGINCYSGAYNSYEDPAPDINLSAMNITAGTTYYFVVSTWFAQTVNYTINIQEEHCAKPINLIASNSTISSATINWTEEGTTNSWEYVKQPAGTGLPTGGGITTDSTTLLLDGLPESTLFEVYVRSNCEDGTFSSWSGPLKFNTLCGAFTVPFFEGFNANSSSQFCWTVADNNNDASMWDMDFTYSFYEGDQSAKFDVGATNENNDMLISPAIMLTGNERLSFFYKTQVSGAIAFKVMLSTTGTNPEDFTTELSPLTSYAVDNFTQKIINLSNVPSGPVYIAWYVPAGLNGGYELMIDNIVVEALPVCAQPTDLAINSLTNNSVELSWTAGNNETTWEVAINEPYIIGTPTPGTIGVPSGIPYNTTTLQPNKLYVAYVRSMCGLNGKSEWSTPLFFTTGCNSYDVPFFEGFNSNSLTQECWRIVNADGDWAQWDMESTVPFEGDEAAVINTGNMPNDDWLISPPINLTSNEWLKYHYKTNPGTNFKVLLSTTNSDLSNFTEVLVPETEYNNANFIKKTVSLQDYTGTVYIAWQLPPSSQEGSAFIIDNVIIEQIPSCPEPLDIEIASITQTSAEVSWTPSGTETQWEVFAYADGEEIPATGTLTSTTTYILDTLVNGESLQPGIRYHVSVKAVCNESDKSILSDPKTFITLISNDDCDTPIHIPVNSGAVCDVYASGTLNGATASSQVNPCGDWTYADDDVWFEFTATSKLQTVSIIDITNGSSYLMFIVYEGDDCGNLTQISDCMGAYAEYGLESSTAVFTDLNVGTKYSIRIFSAEASTNQTTTFNVCVKVPVTPISVNNTDHTVEQLVTDVLFNGNCVQVSNISWSTGTNYPDPDNIFGDNPNGIAYFNQNGSGFPFSEGIVLTTGDALKTPGPAFTGMEQGSSVWLGDTDIDNIVIGMLGDTPPFPSTNASVIEFDFIPSLPTFSLDFIFASEEYGDYIQCFTWDTFAVLLTDDQGNTKNIAVIPGTDKPISVFNISGNGYPGFCPGYNLEYFDQYNVFGMQDSSITSFSGQTVVMSAIANLDVNHEYHLKIVIAESDGNLDSGVFIKGGIFSEVEEIDLGIDRLVATNNAICVGEEVTLQTGLDPTVYEFVWTRDNIIIENATEPTLVVTQPGVYNVKANIIGYTCITEAEIKIEFYPSVQDMTGNPVNLTECKSGGFATFDLSQNTTIILEDLNTADYTISYHPTEADAINNTDAVSVTYENETINEQTLFVRILDINTGCFAIKSFKLIVQDLTPIFTISDDLSLCEGTSGTITVVPGNFDEEAVSFVWALDGNVLTATTSSISVNTAGTYEVTINNNGCTSSKSTIVTVTPIPEVDTPVNITVCNDYILPILSNNNNYYTGPGGTGVKINAGETISATQTLYVYAQSGTNPNCSNETIFTVTIIPIPKIAITQGCENNNYVLEVLFDENEIYNADNVDISWSDNDGEILGTDAKITVKEIGIYQVTVTPKDGADCFGSDEAIVDATTCEIPKGISPNNDGKNDEFDLSDLNVEKISIFNRYGQEVYKKGNYKKEWYGQGDNGNELPTGTYFYVIEIKGGENKTGWVYINREN
ncbi:Fibronectin type III domain protein [compost metagenome]